jgi:hypothetical protein
MASESPEWKTSKPNAVEAQRKQCNWMMTGIDRCFEQATDIVNHDKFELARVVASLNKRIEGENEEDDEENPEATKNWSREMGNRMQLREDEVTSQEVYDKLLVPLEAPE